jgi:hypothetical protein
MLTLMDAKALCKKERFGHVTEIDKDVRVLEP